MLLGRCEFGKDDYSLNIVNLPHDEVQDSDAEDNTEIKEETKPRKGKGKPDKNQSTLF